MLGEAHTVRQTIFAILPFVGAIAMAAAAPAQVDPAAEVKQILIATPEGPNIGLTATAIQRQAPAMNVVQLRGNVEIRTKDMILRADEADYNEKTGEIEARGAVHIKLETQR
jgi:lipopolysaccharide assembly outer membrane protein LptD (OstA)